MNTFRDIETALIIREPWIGKILSGAKTWEMRSEPIRRRGLIGLIRQGSGQVVGVGRLIDSLAPLTRANYMDWQDKHCIPSSMLEEVIASGWIYPWVLAQVQPLKHPVTYSHRSGAVKFTRLDDFVVAELRRQVSTEFVIGSETFANAETKVAHPYSPSTSSFEKRLAPEESGTYRFAPQQAQAFGTPGSGACFIVQAGSTAMRDGSARVKRDRPLRDQLVRQGVLVADSDPALYRFSRDYEFSSPSAAAGIVKDGNASGGQLWKHVGTGKTLSEKSKQS